MSMINCKNFLSYRFYRIEVQLQDEVAKTISSFIDICIKLWFLIGDKVKAANSIAH
jgi:magnesium-transporting ATPase (P-type)